MLLGHTGKLGSAIYDVFKDDYFLDCYNTANFDAHAFDDVERILNRVKPDVVINCIAKLGIEPCEKLPHTAFTRNTLFPKLLAELSNSLGFLLVHFSTDAVYNNTGFTEPLNVYGVTKYGGDCMVSAIAKRFYIFRVSILFGKTTKKNQFVEKMLEKIEKGEKILKIADDIVLSPSYTVDIAKVVKRVVDGKEGIEYGTYHVANEGVASLYALMVEICSYLYPNVKIDIASYKDFPHVGIKNIHTPIVSFFPLRHWTLAVEEYCDTYER